MIPSPATMRLSLSIPTELAGTWSLESEGRVVTADPLRPALLTFGPLVPLPDDVDAWVDDVLRSETPENATLERGGLIERSTNTGWRYRVVDARVTHDGVATELRMAAFYRFFEHTGAALLRIPGAEPVPGPARQALQLFDTAVPDFSSQIAGIHQLFPPTEN